MSLVFGGSIQGFASDDNREGRFFIIGSPGMAVKLNAHHQFVRITVSSVI